MLIHVLNRLAANTGLDPVQQRSTLVDILNFAAKEMHDRLECNRILREVTLTVSPNKVVSLPHFIGELRGMRMSMSDVPFDLHALSNPRYTNSTCSYMWKNWRDMGERPTHTALPAIAPLTINGGSSVFPVTVLISGQTASANTFEESVTVNSASVVTSTFGPEIYKIACLDPRTFNLTIYQGTTEIAVLPNDRDNTRYKLVDVSQAPWSLDTAAGDSLIEVLYKLPLLRLSKDTDQFPAGDDYDNAWFFMSMHIYYQPIQNKQFEAASMMGQALQALFSIKDGTERFVEKKLTFGRNKFFGLFRGSKYCHPSATNTDYAG